MESSCSQFATGRTETGWQGLLAHPRRVTLVPCADERQAQRLEKDIALSWGRHAPPLPGAPLGDASRAAAYVSTGSGCPKLTGPHAHPVVWLVPGTLSPPPPPPPHRLEHF